MDEAEKRDFNGEGDEPTNPVVKIVTGSWLMREEFQNGEVEWYRSEDRVLAWVADLCEMPTQWGWLND